MSVQAPPHTPHKEGPDCRDGPVVGQQLQHLSCVELSSVCIEETQRWSNEDLLV